MRTVSKIGRVATVILGIVLFGASLACNGVVTDTSPDNTNNDPLVKNGYICGDVAPDGIQTCNTMQDPPKEAGWGWKCTPNNNPQDPITMTCTKNQPTGEGSEAHADEDT